MSEIDKKVWKTVANIPRGNVATYGQIADLAGLGRAARRVGMALRKTPDDIKIPWHRVINASGRISLPKNSDGYQLQRQRLMDEGVLVSGDSVDLRTYRWEPGLDELLWKLEG